MTAQSDAEYSEILNQMSGMIHDLVDMVADGLLETSNTLEVSREVETQINALPIEMVRNVLTAVLVELGLQRVSERASSNDA